MSLLELLIVVLASYRLTHLLVFDSIAEPLRQLLGGRPIVGALIDCYWCAGIWVSAGLAIVGDLPWMQLPVAILAVAGGQSLLETLVQRSSRSDS